MSNDSDIDIQGLLDHLASMAKELLDTPPGVEFPPRIEFGLRMMTGELRYPEEWELVTDIHVMDADGWRKDQQPWETPITRKEFMTRAENSSCTPRVRPRPDLGSW